MPVRGGLALTGNAPNRPDSTLPAPAPRKSRSTSAGLSGSDGNDRVVAAVCTITTTVMTKASGTRRTQCSGARSGRVGRGSVPGTMPTTLTPLLSRPSAIVASVAATSPISAPGIFALIFFGDEDHGQHAEADAERDRDWCGRDLARARRCDRASARSAIPVPARPAIATR